MKVKHSRRQYKLTYKKKQYRLKNKKQKTKNKKQKTKRMKSNAKSSYGHFKKSIMYMQRGGVGLPIGWTTYNEDGKIYYYDRTNNVKTLVRPKHDQWFGTGTFPPIPDQHVNLSTNTTHTITLSAQTIFDYKGILTYTGLPVSFVSEHPNIAEANGAILHIKSPGTTKIWAYQPGNDTFNPTETQTPSSTQTVTVTGYYQAHTAPPPAGAESEEESLHDQVFNFHDKCDTESPLHRQTERFKILIANIEKDPKAYSIDRGHTFLYSAFRNFGNVCFIRFMWGAGCIIMQPNKPVPTWMWEADDGSRYNPCNQKTLDLLETTLVNSFLIKTTPPPLLRVTYGEYHFDFKPTNIITSGTQVVTVDTVGTKTDIIVSRDINGIWTWFMDEEQFNYPDSINQILEDEFKNNEGNGFCTFNSGTMISRPGEPTVNLIQVSFSTRVELRQTNRLTGSARSVIRVCNTSYPFHGAIERLRTAQTLEHAIRHGKNIKELAGLFSRDMHLIKTLRNSIFDGTTTRAFMVIDELLFAKEQLLKQNNGNPKLQELKELKEILEELVKIFSINTTRKDEPGKSLTQCENVRVIGDNTIQIMIKSTPVVISEGSFIEFDRWNFSYNPLTISLVPTKAIVVGFGGRFNPTDHKQSVVNRIFYWPWRNAADCWTTSSQYRSIGLTTGYLNENWDSIKLIPCPASTGSPCTIGEIMKWQNQKYDEKIAAEQLDK